MASDASDQGSLYAALCLQGRGQCEDANGSQNSDKWFHAGFLVRRMSACLFYRRGIPGALGGDKPLMKASENTDETWGHSMRCGTWPAVRLARSDDLA